jgi:hypothetical protein
MGIEVGTLMLISAAISAGTAAYTTSEQIKASKRQTDFASAQADLEADQLALQASSEKTAAEIEELNRQRTLNKILSAQRAVFGASGFSVTSGTFTDIQTSDMQRAAEAKRLNATFTDTRQLGFKNNIAQIKNQTYMTRKAGKIARRTAGITGASELIKIGISAL